MNKKGFTLVELLAVIAILAILVIIAMPNVLKMFNESKKNTFLTEAKAIYKQAETEIIQRTMAGTLTDTISSGDHTKMKMDGKNLDYIITIKNSKITAIKVNDDQYCITGDGSFLSATVDQVKEEDCYLHPNSAKWYANCEEDSRDIRCTMLRDNEEKDGSFIEYNYASNGVRVNSEWTDYIKDDKQKTDGLYYIEDPNMTEGGDRVYFYRGNVTNNHIIWADFCWRIVRTVEDGSVRLVYAGTYKNGSCPENGKLEMIGNTKYKWATGKNDNAYAGYMTGDLSATNYADAHKNIEDSYIKEKVDSWYENNLANKGTEVLELLADSAYCNDRSVLADKELENKGYAKERTGYAAMYRLVSFTSLNFDWGGSEIKPTFKCAQTNDKFTVSKAYGNGALKYKIALLTADELTFAGGSALSDGNYDMYLRGDKDNPNDAIHYGIVSMTPGLFNGQVGIMRIGDNGVIGMNSVTYTWRVNPAVSLLASTKVIAGNGTATNPYRVK